MIPPFPELPTLSFGEDRSRSHNFLIEGDNLKILPALAGESIDLLLTDPPYGTEKKFRYNDRWKGYVPRPSEESYVTASEAGSHAGWINYMAPRLQLMKRLLKSSGVIAISIGKEQLFYLGVLMDDIFGEKNRIGIINWQKRYSASNDAKHIADCTDYLLIYVKKRCSVPQRVSAHQLVQKALWGTGDPCYDLDRLKIGDVPLLPFPPLWYQQSFDVGCQSWRHQLSGTNADATILLNAIIGGGQHNATPKPLKLLSKIIQLWCPPDGTILDAFAGSGTTGHAVLDLNARLPAHRRFVLIEQGNSATGDLFARTLTADRLRRVISGEWAKGIQPPLGGGFTFQSTMEANYVTLPEEVQAI